MQNEGVFGLHLAAGVNKQSILSVKSIWHPKKSSCFFVVIMTRIGVMKNVVVMQIIVYLRLVSSLSEQSDNFKMLIKCSRHVTLDEQLIGFIVLPLIHAKQTRVLCRE